MGFAPTCCFKSSVNLEIGKWQIAGSGVLLGKTPELVGKK